jgi:uncharacterized protein YkwD
MRARTSFNFQGMKGLLILLVLAGWVAAAEWQRLPPEEFALLPAVKERVVFEDFNQALMSAAIFHETNRVRSRLGLAPFAHLPKLDEAADLKAAIGVVQTELTHDNPLPLSATPADRVRATGLRYRQVAENIARLGLFDLPAGVTQVGVRERAARTEFYRLDTRQAVQLRSYVDFATAVVASWMNSPGHRAHIVNPEFTALGCAARPCRSQMANHEQVYAVQVFLAPR